MSEHPIDPAMPLDRLDMMLVASGLVESRSKAQRLIKADMCVLTERPSPSRHSWSKPVIVSLPWIRVMIMSLVALTSCLARSSLCRRWADRAAKSGMFGYRASTGGFTDVLLRGGAARVVALDVGHGQLDPRIAGDSRVIEMSGVNIREVTADDLPYRPAMIVSDVSFISLTYVIPVIARIAAPGAQVVLLVKPQFEVGRQGLGKHGIVGDPALREQTLADVVACARQHGLHVVNMADSPIEGMHGNAEYLLYAVFK
ncbi:ribosomal RNA large subunit methyltransferase J [Bifidobacterium bifidum]|nr:ribosomal RNA large subunit methyltransferase J [Bifidobacterium bifidum]